MLAPVLCVNVRIFINRFGTNSGYVRKLLTDFDTLCKTRYPEVLIPSE